MNNVLKKLKKRRKKESARCLLFHLQILFHCFPLYIDYPHGSNINFLTVLIISHRTKNGTFFGHYLYICDNCIKIIHKLTNVRTSFFFILCTLYIIFHIYMSISRLRQIFVLDQICSTVHLTKLWLFNLSGCVSRDLCKNNLLRSLVSRKLLTEGVDLLLSCFTARL